MQPLLDGKLRSCFSMTEPGAGADPTLLTTPGRARRRRVGDQRPQVVLVERIDRRLPDRDVHDRTPTTSRYQALLDDHRADRHARREHPPRRARPWASPTTARASPAATPRSSTRTCGCRTRTSIGNPGDGFALAQKRLGPGRIHHAMRWLGQSQRAFDMLCERALSRYTHGSLLAEKQMIQDWIAESYAEMQAARLLTLQAAWKMDQLHAAGRHYSDARVEIAIDQVLGREGALQRDRPGHPGPRLARLHDRPAARVDVPRRPRRPHLRRARRGPQGHRGPPDAEALQGVRGADRARAHPAQGRARRSSPSTSTASR